MKFRSLLHISCLVLICAPATESAGTPAVEGFVPVKAGEGPLAFFIHPEDSEGRSVSGGGRRNEVMYLCEPAAGTKAVPVWRSENVPVPVPLHRLTKDLVVIERGQECFVWDLPKGTATPLWPGGDQTVFLKAQGGKIFFLRRLEPNPLGGMELKTSDGKTVAKKWFRARDRVCTLTPGDQTKAVELPAPVIEHVLETGPSGIWAVTADEPRKLCLITWDGRVTDVAPFDRHWVACDTKAVFSAARDFVSLTPDYVALSVLTDEQDFHSVRDLIVVDVKKKTVNHVSQNVPIMDGLAYPPPIHMEWKDRTHLLFGGRLGQMKALDVLSGKLKPVAAPLLKLGPDTKSSERTKTGLFETAWGTVWFPGDKTPAASVLDNDGVQTHDLEMSKDGQWAVFCAPDKTGVFLLDGAARQKHRLIGGWCYDITWLPGVAGAK